MEGEAEEELPTSFDGATQTWEVNYQAEGICSFVDVTVCPEGGDINTCDSSLLRSYDCPENMGSPPWYIYGGHGDEAPQQIEPQVSPMPDVQVSPAPHAALPPH